MGKVKRARQKAHNAAVKVKSGEKNKEAHLEDVIMADAQNLVPQDLPKPSPEANLFAGLDLSKYNLKQQLPDLDARSAITSKSLRELKMKKKDKQKLRHDLWIEKLNAIDTAKKKAKAKKHKEQTPIVGDIGALGDVLPTLELLMKKPKGPKGNRNESTKIRGIQKEKKRKNQAATDISIFKQVLSHPAYKTDPTATITEHLQNRQKLENMDNS